MMSVLALTTLGGCFGGRRQAAPPVPQSASAADVEQMWAAAVDLFRHGQWTKAGEAFERVSTQLPPGDLRLQEARFFIAETQFSRGENLQAVRTFRRLADEQPGNPRAAEALLRAGDAYAALWRRPELDPTYGEIALRTYRELLDRFPGTDAARRAGLRIQDLNERFAWKEYRTALFYHRYKAYESAILTLRNLVAEYPRTSIAPVALIKLVDTYKRLGYDEDRQETCAYILRFHPSAPGVAQACPDSVQAD